ncbi:DUF3164 family protein [Methylomonas sp. HW2-6]|uniref:DUF3164 family protein n=1 Tax=Methylomonas sp. HW2-6 TaxID=3376687 RepID=UPI00404129C2
MTAINPEELTEQQLQDLLAKVQTKKAKDREAYKAIVANTVPQAVDLLLKASEDLTAIKTHIFNLFRDVLTLKASAYDIKDQQQSHTFTADKYSITLGYRVLDAWDDTCHTGIQKVNAFLETLAKDENSAKLVETVFRLLRKDAKGNLRANRVIELQKMAEKFNDAGFKDGVDIILKAYQPKRSCWFIEAFYTNDAGEKVGIPLSISAVDFAEDFEFDFAPAAV